VFLVFVFQLARIRSIRHGCFRGGLGIRRYRGFRPPEIGRDRSHFLGCVAEVRQEAVDYRLRARNCFSVRFEELGVAFVS